MNPGRIFEELRQADRDWLLCQSVREPGTGCNRNSACIVFLSQYACREDRMVSGSET